MHNGIIKRSEHVLLPMVIAKKHIGILAATFLFVIFRTIFENDKLPDYDAYSKIFADPDAFSGWNIVFTSLALTISAVASYDVFRLLVFAVGVYFVNKYITRPFTKTGVLLVLFSLILLLEFYMIRLRAGLSIGFFYASYTLYNRKKRTLAFAFALVSLSLHAATFLTLLLVYFPNLIKLKYNKLMFCMYTVVWAVFLVFIDNIAQDRGSHLISQINPVRVVFLIALPTLMLVFLSSGKIPALATKYHSEIMALLSISVSLLALLVVGFFDESGEAIIRVYSLVVGPATFVGIASHHQKWTYSQKTFATFALTVNSLFFINTVYL